ncbi:MAG: hypothetical protein LBV70_02700 [Candidatus Adiutrix sp.]|jgi:hypothetical protein|nr:hypothetical protein [Candidatus Adiutrix sp.]
MKSNKRSLIPGLALALVLAGPLAAAAQAAPAEPAPWEKLESFQDQLWAKEMELEAAQRSGNVQETRTLAAEMNKLRAQIREERRRLAGPGQGGGWERGGGLMGWTRGDCPGRAGDWGPGDRPGRRWGRHCRD